MADKTPYDRYEVPGDGESKDDWPTILLQLWEQQEVEITSEVETIADLPAPDPDAETALGQRRLYLVTNDGGEDGPVFAYDDGNEWLLIGGAGLLNQHESDPDAHHARDHASRHEQGGADELNLNGLKGDLADRQDPKNHATRHHNGGPDELDASDLSGSNGSSGQYLVTTGSSAYWDSPPTGLQPSDFAHETGTFTSTDWDGLMTHSFSLSTDFEAISGAMAHVYSSDQQDSYPVYAGIRSVSTGSVTVEVYNDIGLHDTSVRWHVWGVE